MSQATADITGYKHQRNHNYNQHRDNLRHIDQNRFITFLHHRFIPLVWYVHKDYTLMTAEFMTQVNYKADEVILMNNLETLYCLVSVFTKYRCNSAKYQLDFVYAC